MKITDRRNLVPGAVLLGILALVIVGAISNRDHTNAAAPPGQAATTTTDPEAQQKAYDTLAGGCVQGNLKQCDAFHKMRDTVKELDTVHAVQTEALTDKLAVCINGPQDRGCLNNVAMWRASLDRWHISCDAIVLLSTDPIHERTSAACLPHWTKDNDRPVYYTALAMFSEIEGELWLGGVTRLVLQ